VLRRFPDCQVIAIDGASSMVEMPKLRLAAQLNRVDFRVGELGELPSIDFAAKQTPKEAPGYIVELNFQGVPIHCHHLKSTAQLSSAVEKCCKVLDDEMASMQAPLSSQRTPTSNLSRSGDPACPAGGDPGFPRRRRVPAWTGAGYLQAGAGSRGSCKDGRVAVPTKRSGMG
jgi:hypothetical protein